MVLIVLMEQALLLVEVGVDDGDEERVVETDRSNGADRDPNTAAPSWWRRFVVGAAASVSLSQKGPFECRRRMRVDEGGVGGRWCWCVVDGRRLMCSLSGSSSRCCCRRAMMRVGEPSKLPPDGLQVLARTTRTTPCITVHAKVLGCYLLQCCRYLLLYNRVCGMYAIASCMSRHSSSQ